MPATTVTFLFTDIEGSTQLWERHPQAMQVGLARLVDTNAADLMIISTHDAYT